MKSCARWRNTSAPRCTTPTEAMRSVAQPDSCLTAILTSRTPAGPDVRVTGADLRRGEPEAPFQPVPGVHRGVLGGPLEHLPVADDTLLDRGTQRRLGGQRRLQSRHRGPQDGGKLQPYGEVPGGNAYR